METVNKKVVCAALLCMLVIAVAPGAEAMTCGQISSALAPCLGYLTGKAPLGGCCGGVKNLVGQAKTAADRKTACTCLKSAAGSIQGLDLRKAASLPSTCGVSVPYKISPTTDCNKVQ